MEQLGTPCRTSVTTYEAFKKQALSSFPSNCTHASLGSEYSERDVVHKQA